MVWFRDWDDAWCGLGTGTIHCVVGTKCGVV